MLKKIAIIALFIGSAQADLIKTGPYHDLGNYMIGWSSAAYTTLGDGRNCILFLYGNATSGDPNNSIRCFDSATGGITYAQPDTEDGKKHINGDGLNDRDNQLSLSIPGRGLLIAGGAYLTGKEYFNGFFDYETLHWDYRNDIYSLFIPPEGFNWSTFNPAMSWSEELNVGFVYGGYLNGGPSTFITLIHPKEDGTFALEPLKGIPNTASCMHMRNSSVAVGPWAYVVGGICQQSPNGQTSDVPWFRRFNLVSHQWEQLADLPVVRYLPQVTYDKASGDIVVYGGNGPAAVTEGVAPDKMPDYWTGHNEVYTWNVHDQGPWMDRTSSADMPAVRMPVGAYDPTTNQHCYRGGVYFDGNGNAIDGEYSSSTIWCLKIGANSDDEGTPPVDPLPEVDPSGNPPPVVDPSGNPPPEVDPSGNPLPGVDPSGNPLPGVDPSGNPPPEVDPSGNPPPVVDPSGNPPPVVDPSGNPPPVVDPSGEIKVAALSRMLPLIKAGLSPRNSAKHMRMTELDNGRLYIVAGDWGAPDDYPQDGRQDIHSYDIFTDTWTLESPYCGKEGKYPFHPDEIGQMWDTKRKVMWLGPGIIYPYTDNCNQGGGLRVPLTYFNPQTREWNRSPTAQVPPEFSKTPRPPAHGLYDAKTDSLIFLNDTHTYYYDLDVESWSSFPHKNGRFADGSLARVGRWIYIIDEAPYTLYRWNIDTHAFELVADLPADIRNGDGDDHGRVYLSALGNKIALYQGNHWGQLHPPKNLVVHSKAYIFDTDTNQFQEITWDNPEQVEGNTMTWHSSGWMVLFGCVDSDGCNGNTKVMDHIYLVDLRQFGGTGKDLTN